MRRFFIAGELSDEIVITGCDCHHISSVLRYKPGQEIVVVDSTGTVAKMTLTAIEKGSVKAVLKEYLSADTEAPISVTLVQCLPKGDKMDLITQKAVELGAAGIWPVASRNCVVRYDSSKRQARQQKWQKVADEAAKQCGRTMLAEVLPVTDFKEMLVALPANAVKLMCYEAPGQQPLKTVLQKSAAKEYIVLIGPEGGFTAEEAELCREAGFAVVSMGARILRAETAAIAAMGIVLYEKGDLGGI